MKLKNSFNFIFISLFFSFIIIRSDGHPNHRPDSDILSVDSQNSDRIPTDQNLKQKRSIKQSHHHHRSDSDARFSRENREMQRLKDLVLHSDNKIVDFEHHRNMDASDEAIRHSAWMGPADNATISQYVQRNCTSCLMREEAKWNRIEKIKEDLLQKLNIQSTPNTTSDQPLPSLPNLQGILSQWKFGIDNTMTADQAQEMMADASYSESPNPDDAKTERVYAFATKAPIYFGLPEEMANESAYFRFSLETMNYHVEEAELHVHINRPKSDKGVLALQLKLEIFTIDSLDGKTTLVHNQIFKRNYRRMSEHWEKVDLSKTVRHWFRKPEKNFGLIIRAMYNGENLANVPTTFTIQGDNQIYLDITTKDGAARRAKRATAVRMDCTERDNESRCCRYPLVLDFESFGWDWVIAPKKYLAYYCSGECPFQHLQRYVHTHLVQQANPKGSVGPCCYPTQMAPILMVYRNDKGEVMVSMVPGMVVTKCGCA